MWGHEGNLRFTKRVPSADFDLFSDADDAHVFVSHQLFVSANTFAANAHASAVATSNRGMGLLNQRRAPNRNPQR